MTQKANNYARAIYELGINSADLGEVRDIFSENPELEEALRDPSVPDGAKHNIIDKIFPKATLNFLKLLSDNGGIGLIYEICDAYEALRAEADGVLKAELIYCTPPTEEQIEGIKRRIAKLWGKSKIDLKLTRDTDIIGGFIIRSGDEEIDHSIRGRLAGLSQKLIRR